MNSSSLGESNWQHYWKNFHNKGSKIRLTKEIQVKQYCFSEFGYIPSGLHNNQPQINLFGVLGKEGTEGTF